MSTRQLPAFSVVEKALQVTTERLVREFASPTVEAPDWSEFEWTVARAVCAMQGISALLATHLRWRGPDSWQEFLREQHEQTLACSHHIGERLARLHESARRERLAFVALKGSAVRELALHAPGVRPMGDIDLLVRPADLELASAVVRSLGYHEACATSRDVTFMPTASSAPRPYGEHPDNPLRIELHPWIVEELPLELVDITDSLWPSSPVPGSNPYASFAALMRHLLLHAAGNMRANALRFLQIYEIAVCARRMIPPDWQELLGLRPRHASWWIYPALSMAERHFPGSVPADQLERFASVCPSRLRSRYKARSIYSVSWSNLRIPALPGVEWSRSWREALRFARSRAFPSREKLDELAKSVATLPNLSRARWYQSSHAERIVRWVFERPPRVQTMFTVQAALEDAAQPRA